MIGYINKPFIQGIVPIMRYSGFDTRYSELVIISSDRERTLKSLGVNGNYRFLTLKMKPFSPLGDKQKTPKLPESKFHVLRRKNFFDQ